MRDPICSRPGSNWNGDDITLELGRSLVPDPLIEVNVVTKVQVLAGQRAVDLNTIMHIRVRKVECMVVSRSRVGESRVDFSHKGLNFQIHYIQHDLFEVGRVDVASIAMNIALVCQCIEAGTGRTVYGIVQKVSILTATF